MKCLLTCVSVSLRQLSKEKHIILIKLYYLKLVEFCLSSSLCQASLLAQRSWLIWTKTSSGNSAKHTST